MACSKLEVPQHAMNTMDKRRRMHYKASKVNGLVNGLTTGTGLVNGALVYKARPEAVSGTSDSTPAGSVNDAKPHSTVNGAVPPVSRVKRTMPSKALRKQGGTTSGANHASTAGVVNVGVNDVSSSDKMAPEQSFDPSAPTKIWRRRSKCWWRGHKKRVKAPPVTTSMPPHEEEDWEEEVQEAKLADWEQMSFGTKRYDPMEVLGFAFRDLAPYPLNPPSLPSTASYHPDLHHPPRVRWSRCRIPFEPGQFADAEE